MVQLANRQVYRTLFLKGGFRSMRALRSPSTPIAAASFSRDKTLAAASETADQTLFSDGLMTVGEAADFLRVSRSSIYLLMDQGKLPFAKFGKSRRIPRRALMELVQRSLVSG
jgi:excisionase family DNA binding protein